MNDEISEIYAAAQAALINRQYEHAYNCLMTVVRHQPDHANAYFLLSRIASEFKNYKRELELLTKADSLSPNNPMILAHLAKAYAASGDVSRAYELLQAASSIDTTDAFALDAIGIAYNRLNMYKEAAEFFERATQYNTSNYGMYFNLGATLKFCGDFAGARAALEKAIALYPTYYKAHAALTALGGITPESNHVDQLLALLPGINNDEDYLHISHALSKEYEALGEYDKAFAQLEAGKQRKRATQNYDVKEDIATFSALKKYFSATSAAQLSKDPSLGKGAIFVVGMPRSGTTLVERIISSHSQVATAGELHNFSQIAKSLAGNTAGSLLSEALVDQLGHIDYRALGELYLNSTAHLKNGQAYLVDKLPLNVLYAGHIARALPAAKIVCLDRNPLDTIFSNYRQLFSLGDNTYAYSLSLETTTQFYIEFNKLIHFWKTRFPENVYMVNYESLVKNPLDEVKRLIEFCELPWEDRCLTIEKNDKPVATASAVQVRSPISDKSVGQWKHYAAYAMSAEKLLKENGLL